MENYMEERCVVKSHYCCPVMTKDHSFALSVVRLLTDNYSLGSLDYSQVDVFGAHESTKNLLGISLESHEFNDFVKDGRSIACDLRNLLSNYRGKVDPKNIKIGCLFNNGDNIEWFEALAALMNLRPTLALALTTSDAIRMCNILNEASNQLLYLQSSLENSYGSMAQKGSTDGIIAAVNAATVARALLKIDPKLVVYEHKAVMAMKSLQAIEKLQAMAKSCELPFRSICDIQDRLNNGLIRVKQSSVSSNERKLTSDERKQNRDYIGVGVGGPSVDYDRNLVDKIGDGSMAGPVELQNAADALNVRIEIIDTTGNYTRGSNQDSFTYYPQGNPCADKPTVKMEYTANPDGTNGHVTLKMKNGERYEGLSEPSQPPNRCLYIALAKATGKSTDEIVQVCKNYAKTNDLTRHMYSIGVDKDYAHLKVGSKSLVTVYEKDKNNYVPKTDYRNKDKQEIECLIDMWDDT